MTFCVILWLGEYCFLYTPPWEAVMRYRQSQQESQRPHGNSPVVGHWGMWSTGMAGWAATDPIGKSKLILCPTKKASQEKKVGAALQFEINIWVVKGLLKVMEKFEGEFTILLYIGLIWSSKQQTTKWSSYQPAPYMNLAFEFFPMSHPLALGARIILFLGSHNEQSVCPWGGEQAWGRQPGYAARFAKIGTLGLGLALNPATAASCLTWSKLLTLSETALSSAERRRTLLRECLWAQCRPGWSFCFTLLSFQQLHNSPFHISKQSNFVHIHLIFSSLAFQGLFICFRPLPS